MSFLDEDIPVPPEWDYLPVGPTGRPRINVYARPQEGVQPPPGLGSHLGLPEGSVAEPSPEPQTDEERDILSRLILEQEANTGEPSPLRRAAPPQEETTPREDSFLDDPFERAAARTRQSVRPEGGRMEGRFTEAASNPVTMGKALFDVTPPGQLIEAARNYEEGHPIQAALQTAGALIPGGRLAAGAAGDIGGELVKGATVDSLLPDVIDQVIPAANAQESSVPKSKPSNTANYNELQRQASEAWRNRTDKSDKDYVKFRDAFLASKGYKKTEAARRSETLKLQKAAGSKEQEPRLVAPMVPAPNPDAVRRAAGLPAPDQNPPVQVQTVGGPAEFRASDLATLGAVGLASVGMAFAPRIFGKLQLGRVPRLERPVQDAVPGTVAISNRRDLLRTYDDANAGVLRIAKAAGITPQVLDRLTQTFRLQTRATANSLVDAAVRIGRMETPGFTFSTRVAMQRLADIETPQVRDYLKMLDTLDRLKVVSIKSLSPQTHARRMKAFTGGRMHGEDIISATSKVKAFEQANPELVQIKQAYQQNLRDLRKFENSGEYATISNTKKKYQNVYEKNYVPEKGRQTEFEPAESGSTIASMAETMRNRLRRRLENEAVGNYVDEMRKANPNLFRSVSRDELFANKNWEKNVVSFYRRGVKERYTTDPYLADILRLDPYAITGIGQQALYSTKRLFEMSTTGELAPWFAVTSAVRSYLIGKHVTEAGYESPTIAGTLAAIPRQIIPQLANKISRTIESSSSGWISSVFGQQYAQSLSTRLANVYINSLWHTLEAVGGGRGSIMQQQMSATNKLTDAISKAAGPAKTLLEGYRALLNAMHNAPAFDYARRNLGKTSLPDLARRARNLTGDPRIGGEFYTRLPGEGRAVPIRMEMELNRLSQTLNNYGFDNLAKATDPTQLAKLFGWATEGGRQAIPWYNATIQGAKRIGAAYLENPAKFVMRTWAYTMLPAAASYLLSRGMGTDPDGRSYVDHLMNRRSEYQKMMSYYLPIPGMRAEDGIEYPAVHEFSMPKHMMEVALDHAFRSSLFTQYEDFLQAGKNYLGIVAEPASPPLVGLTGAHFGYSSSGGPFTGEAYQKYVDPYDQNGGLPSSIELYSRALAGGIADVFGTGYAAAHNTKGGVLSSTGNFMKAASRRIIEKMPLVRDVTRVLPPIIGTNNISDQLFKKQKGIRNLDRYYNTWVRQSGMIDPKATGGEGVAATALGPRPPGSAAGINQPPPTNPLFTMFAEEIHNKFIRDNPTNRRGEETGAMGFPSLWKRYRIATDQLTRIKKVNEGNYSTWQTELSDEQRNYLKERRVDPENIREVRNFYEKQRQDAARILLFSIKAVEDEFSKRVGQPVKIEDLDPYGQGLNPVSPSGQGSGFAAPTEF